MQGRISFQLHAWTSFKPTVILVYYVHQSCGVSVTGSTSQKLQHSLIECSSCPSFFPAVTHALACRKRALSERNTCLHWSQFDDLHHAYRNPTIAVEDHQQFMLDGKARQKRGARLFASLNKLELQSELQACVQNHTFSAPEVFNHTDEIHIK